MNMKPAGPSVAPAPVQQPVMPEAESVINPTIMAPSAADAVVAAEVPTAAASSSTSAITFDRLQESLVERFESTNSMVSTTLSLAFDWIDSGEKVSFSVDKPFAHNFLEQDHKKIAEAVSALLGRHVMLEIKLDTSRSADGKEKDAEPAIPPHVEMLRQMFRGTIS
jgi:hypothetical protein